MAISKASLLSAAELDAELASGGDPLKLFRKALADGRARLHEFHLQGASGPDVVNGYTWLIDQLVARAWKHHLPRLPDGAVAALVAVGGYGRAELHPGSDVDLMVLLAKRAGKEVREFVEVLLRFLWDMGLQVGHSVRTPRECQREAKNDITVATNVMEARWLAGNHDLFAAMERLTSPPAVWPSPRFFKAKLAEQRARHQRFHDTAYNLEPNLKDGPGGLRDIHVILWVARRHFGATTLHDLVDRGFLTAAEHRSLIQGRNMLWRLRNGLHFLTGRAEDRLLFDYQRTLAKQMHYKDQPGRLAVERLMMRYYRTVKELRLLNEILLQHFEEEILTRKTARTVPINRRFRAHKGFLEVTNSRVFERSPWAMLELFLLLEQHPEIKGVRASTIRLLRANRHRVDRKFRQDITCRSLFMEIMRQPTGLTHTLRRMNAYGILGAYIPVFGRIVGQMQHDLFHVYTVDEHILFVVRNLRRLTVPEFHHELPMASDLIKRVVKPERLYLGAFFHDIAKGRGGDHSELGEHEAFHFCKHHDMSDYDAHFVAWLVRHHLSMSRTAQHEDISDPDVVLKFAREVGDQEHLDNLYLLTVADMRGTSPTVWNAWKGRLLSQLYAATTRMLRRGVAHPLKIEERIADLKKEALKVLARSKIPQEAVERHWRMLDDDYFLRHDAESIAWHAERVVPSSIVELPLVASRYHPEHEGIEFMIFAPARSDLFTAVTGGIDRMNFNIVDARLHVTRAGLALDTFVVLPREGDTPTDRKELDAMQKDLRDQILSPRPGRDPRQSHMPRSMKQFPIPTKVSFSVSSSGQSTLMEVTAQDRPGLLHQVARALEHCGANLLTAKVATYGIRAEDVFFLVDPDGGPLTNPEQIVCLKSEVYARLGGGDTEEETQGAARAIVF